MKKNRIKILLFFILVVAIVSPFIIFPLLNNAALHNFSKQLYNCPLPANAIIVEKHNLCGKLNGNGNGMDFMAAMLVESDLTIDELNDFYGKVTFYTAKNDNTTTKDTIALKIEKPSSPTLKIGYLEQREIYFKELESVNSYFNYYILILYDGGYSAVFDIRGH